jgi:hypothetical protein
MSIVFDEVSKPVDLKAIDNPYSEAITSLKDRPTRDDGSVRALSFPLACDGLDSTTFKRVRRQLTEASAPVGVSIRMSTTYDAKEKTATVTFWVIPKVTRRTRKTA